MSRDSELLRLAQAGWYDDLLSSLLSYSADTPRQCTYRDAKNRTALHHVCASNARNDQFVKVQIIKSILSIDPTVALIRDDEGRTPLHHAVQTQCYEGVQHIVRRCPSSASVFDEEGNVPLHCAAVVVVNLSLWWDCRVRSTMEKIVHELTAAFSAGAKVRNEAGETPLHVMCKAADFHPNSSSDDNNDNNNAVLRLIRFMVTSCPESTAVADGNGNIPLHVACRPGRRNSEVMRYLVEVHGKALRSINHEQSTPLHILCGNGTYNAKAMRTLVERGADALLMKDRDGMTPLHLACSRGAPAHELRILIEACPAALRVTDNDAMTPIHVLCSRGSVIDSIEMMMMSYPAGVVRPDHRGRTCLHRVCSMVSRWDGGRAEIIAAILRSRPDAAIYRDDAGKTPLHVACSELSVLECGNRLMVEMCSSLRRDFAQYGQNKRCDVADLEEHIDPFLIVDDEGLTPLHYWCRYSLRGAGLQALLDRCPDAAKVVDRSGRTPLHEACSGKKFCSSEDRLSSIEALVQAYPDAAALQDETKSTPLHVTCAIRLEQLSVVKTLVSACPESVAIENEDGHTPLSLLCYTFRGTLACAISELETRAWVEDEYVNQTIWIKHFLDKAKFLISASHVPVSGAKGDGDYDAERILHASLRRRDASVALVRLISLLYPHQLYEVDRSGNLPLHLAALRSEYEDTTVPHDTVDLIYFLFMHNPSAARTLNGEQLYPLNIMLKSGKKWGKGMKTLLQAFPGALHKQEISSDLFPAVLERVGEGLGTAEVFSLLSGRPCLFQSAFHKENRPEKRVRRVSLD